MEISQKNETLKKLYFLKAIGYKFINENFIFSQKISEFADVDELNHQISQCNLCHLRKSANTALLGYGNKQSKIMFVCLAPSPNADKNAELVSGMLGAKFSELVFNSLNLNKDEFYVSSILRCKNLNLEGKDMANDECFELCRPYLMEEIELIKPSIIITLGEEAFFKLYGQNIANTNFKSLRGSVLKFQNTLLMPTYSVMWLMKNPSFEDVFCADLKKIKGMI
ncbi:uracil-DNA glycosylase [Campylobacter sp. RM9344]|uniref:Uracil-DNA glycosylase n=1 Tax=Campylobacter californiensis TaxID=1032243 RepID=A0AAW3ZX64_9BACT|nr:MULTISPECIES: uracil-DNA glycosylase [unclassified Campylobacter]MBE2983835.1 uracil-DNA glycosylase [Campylobacter sp. RM6883]MBE2985601.1 uracil-DNA glycosylase [Campylobacter sp. RM12919]MBE2987370.1 uracil-DNA glycosylase [Campylobacter sp. RM12920]MBE2994373.1 uracil-DNA glycosylase [Campylobacter sp. RM6913]MBE3022167.1 uracil-DNA glycosylase [Campylobacter sp. 7477a]MBE3028681.1 uracil-DNA glycosylase [Campylobacter sp. RM9344]